MRTGNAALCGKGFSASDHLAEGHPDHTLKVK